MTFILLYLLLFICQRQYYDGPHPLIATGNDETSDVEELELLRARPGALEALSEIKSRGISQCTCSDGDLENLKINLEEAGIDWTDFFDDLYQMTSWKPKDFSYIIRDYQISQYPQIKPENLLVIGDNYILDLAHAKKQGCQTLWVPESKGKISLEEIKRLIC